MQVLALTQCFSGWHRRSLRRVCDSLGPTQALGCPFSWMRIIYKINSGFRACAVCCAFLWQMKVLKQRSHMTFVHMRRRTSCQKSHLNVIANKIMIPFFDLGLQMFLLHWWNAAQIEPQYNHMYCTVKLRGDCSVLSVHTGKTWYKNNNLHMRTSTLLPCSVLSMHACTMIIQRGERHKRSEGTGTCGKAWMLSALPNIWKWEERELVCFSLWQPLVSWSGAFELRGC